MEAFKEVGCFDGILDYIFILFCIILSNNITQLFLLCSLTKLWDFFFHLQFYLDL